MVIFYASEWSVSQGGLGLGSLHLFASLQLFPIIDIKNGQFP